MEKNENCKENRFLSMDSLKKNSRFYLVAAFLAAAILALLCVGNGIWKEYRNSAVRNQKDQMLLAVEHKIVTFISNLYHPDIRYRQ